MNKLIKKIEDIMVAITFAEAGEFDQANTVLGNKTSDPEMEIDQPIENKPKAIFES